MSVRLDWSSAVEMELGLPHDESTQDALVELVRSVRRVADRGAVLRTVYLLGVSVGQGRSHADASRRIEELAARWRGIDWRD